MEQGRPTIPANNYASEYLITKKNNNKDRIRD